MKNPYEILGIHESASDAQIRDAYKTLARKYQPDGSSSSSSSKKMDELNWAYDEIILMRSSRENAQSGGHNNSYNENQQQNGYNENYNRAYSNYADIRSKINDGRLDDAQMLLDGIPRESRNAEWYYLKGSIQNRRGWLEEAAKNFGEAYNREPNNFEYRNAYESFNRNKSGGYRQPKETKSGCSGCDMCTGLICADCCCECMGGDLIRCC